MFTRGGDWRSRDLADDVLQGDSKNRDDIVLGDFNDDWQAATTQRAGCESLSDSSLIRGQVGWSVART